MAEMVWARLGNVPNFIEPFFGSGAVLLARPTKAKVETVNDIDSYLTNFWRALQAVPDEVAKWCDSPVNENDLHARHKWLCNQEDFRNRMRSDPDYYDAKIAGWWGWGISAWIGDGWCSEPKPQIPHLGNAGMGIHRGSIPHLGDAGRGGRPHLGRNQGIHAGFRTDGLYEYLNQLAERVRRVRVCCGDWSRITGDSVTIFHGLTGVFLDPPYAATDRADCYSHDSRTVAGEVQEWAIKAGENKLFRIALCGYEGDYQLPESWEAVAWKANGGYGNRAGANNQNATRERIWYSPHCLKPAQERGLFDLDPELAEFL